MENLPGKLILILGPSGSGKGTIIKYIKEHYPQFVFPISCTTRNPRPGEKDGEVYYFIDKVEFKQKIDAGDFLEYAVVHNENYYGTLKSEIIDPLKAGRTVLREVDYQGVQSISEIIPSNNLSTIFITTNSWEDLKQRIQGRSDIPDAELRAREESYAEESAFKDQCDYVIINEDGKLDGSLARVDEILRKINQS